MKNLVEIIEDCKLNKIENMDKKELQYAVIAITSIANMSMSAIMQLYQKVNFQTKRTKSKVRS